MKVCKFGGSSLAGPSQVAQVCSTVLADPSRRIVVVSAPGKRNRDDAKVTDLLIRCAEQQLADRCGANLLPEIIERYAHIQQQLDLDPGILAAIDRDLRNRLDADPSRPGPFMERLKAAGEDNCARLVAEALRQRGAEAHYVSPCDAGMLLSSEYGNARLLPESYARLSHLRGAPGITVFPGFFGCTPDGDIVTFPRGGSDITGAILAAAVRAQVYENFTDVDGVFAADPRIVPHPRLIPEITYREMRELAYSGSTVLHDESVMPAIRAGIPICVKHTQRPDGGGTRIVPERTHKPGDVIGVAGDDGFCTIFVSKYLMNREIGFGRHVLQFLEEEGLAYEHSPSGIDNMSVILHERTFSPEVEARILHRIRSELGAEEAYVERGLALVMLVGEGMRFSVGLAARATQALAEAGVNIEMMNQGSSEISIMFGVKAENRQKAILALYRAFFSKRSQRKTPEAHSRALPKRPKPPPGRTP